MSILKDSLKSFMWNLVGSIIVFVFQIFLAKYLGANMFGQANYYLGFTNTIVLFLYFGVQTYIPKNIQFKKDKKKFISEIFFTITVAYIILSPVITIILIKYIAIKYIFIVIIISYLMIILEMSVSYYVGIGNTQKGMFYKRFSLSVLQVLIFLILIFVLGKSAMSYIYAFAISYLVLCVFILKDKLKFCGINFKFIKVTFNFYLIQIFYGLYIALSKVIQGNISTFESVAILSVALTLGNATNMFGDTFAKVVMPQFSKAWKEKDIKSLKENFRYVARMNAYLVLPIAIGAVINSRRILEFLGKGYNGGEVIFSLILISQFFNSFVGPNGTLLNMTNNERYEILNGIVKLLVGISLGILLGEKYCWGIACSIAVAEIVINILKTIQINKIFSLLPYGKKDLKFIFVIFLIESLGFYFITKVESLVIWLILNIIFGILCYWISFKFSPHNKDNEILFTIQSKLSL